ncbi:MAG: hypothetical protein IE909_02525 [Campylobacterales bacterium]|nr:hypothetical protein [Campylobacterales bacterium]
MKVKYKFIIFFLVLGSVIFYVLQTLKSDQIEQIKEKTILKTVEKSDLYLKALIREKQNITTTIAVGLIENNLLINALKNPHNNQLNLYQLSMNLKNITDFKNVWFQLVDNKGYAIQRSWTDLKGDQISLVRKDIQKLLLHPKIINTISVGKFDLTFKTMIPIFQEGKFLGLLEVITHFNSVANKLAKNGIKSFFLVDRKYKQQLTHPFTGLFANDYYVANLDADARNLRYLKKKGVQNYINLFRDRNYIYDKELDAIVSYHLLKDINEQPMCHILLVNDSSNLDLEQIKQISYAYNLYILLSILTLLMIFYFVTSKIFNLNATFKKKIFYSVALIYLISIAIVYRFFDAKYSNDIEINKQNIQSQTVVEYNSILNSNKKIADLIFNSIINKPHIVKMFEENNREALFNTLASEYQQLKLQYNIRQIHFHTKDNHSFLRMHRPDRFGDSLVGVRTTVEYVNKYLKPYHGYEEGKTFNGFRHIYPLFNQQNQHVGSVEVSFDIYSFLESYLNIFNAKRVNFLLSSKNANEKLSKDELLNYTPSPIEGFYFDNAIIKKIENEGKGIVLSKKNTKNLQKVAEIINQGKIDTVHFSEMDELTVIIPIINQLSHKVVASVNISKSDKSISNIQGELYKVFVIIALILLFAAVLIYRELLNKINIQNELSKSQKILDSQTSFILLTNGMQIAASNKSMLEFFGFDSLEDFKLKHNCICDYFLEEKGKNYIQNKINDLSWIEYLKQNKIKYPQVKMKNKDGNEHIFLVEIQMFDQEYFIVTFIDITHLKQIESQLILSEKMASLGNMIGNIAHQWRQPLSVISTSASGVQIKREYGLLNEEELDHMMEAIITNAQYLSDTIDTFRNFIKEKKSVKEVLIQENIDTILKILEPTLRNNHIKLINNIDYHNPLRKTMPVGELSQVISNLINNAKDVLLEKNIENPSITISCYGENGKIIIIVEDNGGGVPEDIKGKIFEPYFTTKHQSQGTGLGLYMSNQIVTDSLSGTLEVMNTQEGAKFIISL